MEEFRSVFFGVVGGAIALVALLWSGLDERSRDSSHLAYYGWRARLIACIFLLSSVFICFTAAGAREEDRLIAWGMGGVVLILSTAHFLEVMVLKLQAVDRGLKIRSVWHGSIVISWGDLKLYKYYNKERIHCFSVAGLGDFKFSDRLVGIKEIVKFAKRGRGPA